MIMQSDNCNPPSSSPLPSNHIKHSFPILDNRYMLRTTEMTQESPQVTTFSSPTASSLELTSLLSPFEICSYSFSKAFKLCTYTKQRNALLYKLQYLRLGWWDGDRDGQGEMHDKSHSRVENTANGQGK